jgi:predicted transcriptional regulator
MSKSKISGYDNYYLKNIGCYYCPEPEIEGWFFEASIHGVIFLNESLKYPAIEYGLGYWYAFSCDLGEVNPDQYFTIGDTPINKKKSEVVNHIFSSIQITSSKEEDIPVTEIVIITSAAAGTIALLGILTTEWGKNKFYLFLLLLGPLYLRTVKEEVFDNQKRYCMYNHIAENQPVVYSDIKKTCNLSDGEINWHAHMMIQLDLIKKERKGFHLFFYLSKSPRLQPTEFIRLTDMQQAIFDLIVKNPGINQKETIEKIGLKQQNISYNLLKLEEKGKINVEKKGKIKFY